MKKKILSLLAFIALAGAATPAVTAQEVGVAAGTVMPNYRYVDYEILMTKYYLAAELNDKINKKQSDIETQAKKLADQIKNQEASIQKKMKNQTYKSEKEYNADVKKYENLQSTAQEKMTKWSQELEQMTIEAQQTVNKAVDDYIKEYNATKGYDAIFFKASTLYIRPDLDITNEVIEGLNTLYMEQKQQTTENGGEK